MKNLLLVAVSAFLLFACCGDKNKGLSNTHWLLTEMSGEAIDREALDNKESYTLNFETDSIGVRVYGLADGNRYFGMPTINEKENIISMGEMGATRMMSPNQEREDKYMKVLHEATKYKISCGELVLLQDDKVIAKFSANKDQKCTKE